MGDSISAVKSAITYFAPADPECAKLEQSMHNGLIYIPCRTSEDVDKLLMHMRSHGISCREFEIGIVGLDKNIVVFAKDQYELVKPLLERYQAQALDGRDVPKSMIHSASRKMEMIPSLDSASLSMTLDYMQQSGIIHSVEGPLNDSFRIYYPGDKHNEVSDIMMLVSVNMQGKTGEFYRSEQMFREQKYHEMIDKMLQPETLTLSEIKEMYQIRGSTAEETKMRRKEYENDHKRMCLIDRDGNTMTVTPTSATVAIDGQRMDYSKTFSNRKSFYDSLQKQMIENMNDPVIVNSRDQLVLTDSSDEERNQFLDQLEQERGKPIPDRETMREYLSKENGKHDILLAMGASPARIGELTMQGVSWQELQMSHYQGQFKFERSEVMGWLNDSNRYHLMNYLQSVSPREINREQYDREEKGMRILSNPEIDLSQKSLEEKVKSLQQTFDRRFEGMEVKR